MTTRMRFARRGAGAARVIAVLSGIIGVIASFASGATPEVRANLGRFQLSMLVLFLASVSVSAICAGIVRSGEEPRRRSRVKTIFVRVAFCLLFLMGPFFLTTGYGYYVKAKERESQQDMLLARDGHYENPYREKQRFCDFLGVVCMGSWCLWLLAAFLLKLAESTANVCRTFKSQSKGTNS